MANERVRRIYQFLSVSDAGKKQSAFGAFQPQADIDVRETCTVTMSEAVTRTPQRDCDGVDVIRENIEQRYMNWSFSYDDGFTPKQAARWLAYLCGTAAAPTGTADTNEVTTLTKTGTVTGGTFYLTLTHEGKTGQTEAIAYNASNATILAALLKKTGSVNAMGKLIKSGDVTLGGGITTALTITWGGRFAGANMTQMVVVDAALTGGGTIEETTTTVGSNKYHVFTRSTDATLPLFSFIVGDKNDSYDDFEFGDCVVNSVSFDLTQSGGGLAKMTVEGYCNYTPQRLTAYTAPTCVNITPLKVEDCKYYINSVWETPDVESCSVSLNNNVPVEAAFAYDDIDISLAMQRGDIPEYGISASIYGSPDTSLYQLAEAEETDNNGVPFYLYLGQGGNRVIIYGAETKVKFQSNRMGFAGPLAQSTINLDFTPYNSPPLTYEAYLSTTTTYLTASA